MPKKQFSKVTQDHIDSYLSDIEVYVAAAIMRVMTHPQEWEEVEMLCVQRIKDTLKMRDEFIEQSEGYKK